MAYSTCNESPQSRIKSLSTCAPKSPHEYGVMQVSRELMKLDQTTVNLVLVTVGWEQLSLLQSVMISHLFSGSSWVQVIQIDSKPLNLIVSVIFVFDNSRFEILLHWKISRIIQNEMLDNKNKPRQSIRTSSVIPTTYVPRNDSQLLQQKNFHWICVHNNRGAFTSPTTSCVNENVFADSCCSQLSALEYRSVGWLSQRLNAMNLIIRFTVSSGSQRASQSLFHCLIMRLFLFH